MGLWWRSWASSPSSPLSAYLSAGRGIALAFTSGATVEILIRRYAALGQNRLWGVPIGALIAGTLAVATAVLVRQTRFGRNVIAIGGNPRAALGAGLPIRRVLLAVYVVCAVFAAIAGMLVTARSAAADPSFVGLLIELSAITAVVVGGTPLRGGKVRVLGTVAGALLMQLVFSTLIRHDLSDSDARMVQAAIIIAAVYFQPRSRGQMSALDLSRPPAPPPQEGDVEQEGLVPVTLAYLRRTPAIPVLIVVVSVGAVAFGSTFLSARNFASMAVASSFLLIIAVGMTFVIISGGIDLSVGSMLALGAVLMAYSSRWGSGPAILIPLAVCTTIGLIQGLLIGKGRMPPFIVTLAGLLFARGLAFKVSDNGNTTHLIPEGEWVTALGQSTFLGVGLARLDRFGGPPVGDGAAESDPVRLQHIRHRWLRGGCPPHGSSGGPGQDRPVHADGISRRCRPELLVAARSSSGLSTIGAGLELEAIAAVVIGGTLLTGGSGGLTGTLAGVLLLGVIENLINQVGTLSYYHQLVVSGTFLIIVVSAQSLFAERELRRAGKVT